MIIIVSVALFDHKAAQDGILFGDNICMKQQKGNKSSKKAQDINNSPVVTETKRNKSLSLRELRQNYSSLPNKQQKLQHSKTAIISKISQQLHQKLQLDLKARDAITKHERQKLKRLSIIQAEIYQINRESSIKIENLNKLQKTIFNRMEEQIKRDRYQQKKLKKQYEKLLKEEEKIVITKQVKDLKEKEDWIMIEKEQRRLSLMARSFQSRHHFMGKQISIDFKQNKKNNSKQDEQKFLNNLKSPKRERKKKNAEELKQMGRQFLQHAKKVQTQKLKQNTKLMDVYKKSIDYLPEIRTILKSNAEDLSKPLENTEVISKSKKKKVLSLAKSVK